MGQVLSSGSVRSQDLNDGAVILPGQEPFLYVYVNVQLSVWVTVSCEVFFKIELELERVPAQKKKFSVFRRIREESY